MALRIITLFLLCYVVILELRIQDQVKRHIELQKQVIQIVDLIQTNIGTMQSQTNSIEILTTIATSHQRMINTIAGVK
jgi:hypothetical protein